MRKIVYLMCALMLASCGSKDTNGASGAGEGGMGGIPVDMGLSVLWADRNVGASSPEKAGLTFGYGDAEGKQSESPDDYRTFADAAARAWGGNWRMPTADEVQELIERCTWVWVVDGDRRGYEITAPNGAKLFLPATGLRLGGGLTRKKGFGGYWTSTPSDFSADHARALVFVSAKIGSLRADSLKADPHLSTFKLIDNMRQYGFAVRPVKK